MTNKKAKQMDSNQNQTKSRANANKKTHPKPTESVKTKTLKPTPDKTLLGFALNNVSTVLKSAKGSLKTLGILENESFGYLQQTFGEIRKNPSVVLAEKAAKDLTVQLGTSLRKELIKRMGDTLGISEKAETDALRSKLNEGGSSKKTTHTKSKCETLAPSEMSQTDL